MLIVAGHPSKNKPYVLVLYGSQTGTAEDFGDQLCKEMEQYGIVGDLKDAEDFSVDELAEQSAPGEVRGCVCPTCLKTVHQRTCSS